VACKNETGGKWVRKISNRREHWSKRDVEGREKARARDRERRENIR